MNRAHPLRTCGRLPKHISAAVDMLREHGAENIRVAINKHARLYFVCAGRELSVSASCTPTDEDAAANMIRQAIRRSIAQGGRAA